MRKTNKEKFQELDSKQKREYIWDYYRWHIIGGIVGIFAIIYIINFINRPAPPVYSADLVVTGLIVVDEEVLDESRVAMQEAIDGGISTLPANWAVHDQMAIINDQMLVIKMQTKECDVMAASEIKFDNYMNIQSFDAFYALDTIPELEPILEKYKDQLVTGQTVSDTEEHVYGIRVDELKHTEGIKLAEELVIGMSRMPKDVDAAVDLIKYILGEE